MSDLFDDNDHQPVAADASVEDALVALADADEDELPGAVIVYGLSGLTQADVTKMSPLWNSLTAAYRRKLMRLLAETSEANFELDYQPVAILALGDADAETREIAIEALWENETIQLMDRLVEMAQWDEATNVRAAAASALGRFILLGELGKLPESDTVRAQDVAVSLLTDLDENVAVRRRALEAIANCSHEIVEDAIMDAYEGVEYEMRVSAVFAMGRTRDESWAETVLRELDSDDSQMRYEAARAAGELGIKLALRRLTSLALSVDPDVKGAAIWSLGEIGGKQAMDALSALAFQAEEDGNDDLLEAIEDALGNATLGGDDWLDDLLDD